MLSRMVMLLLFAFALLLPRYATAAIAVPMCSPYGECATAPPPEVPPTGGEIRGVYQTDPGAPGLELVPQQDRDPPKWQVPAPDPAVVTLALLLLVAPSIATGKPNFGSKLCGSFGVRTEVFRPPCDA
jgi:hypothetical protein